MQKLLVVDGSNLLFQMFYGMPARIIGKRGKPIHGTLGFIGALLKIIRRETPTHVVVLFDGEHQNERGQIDADYKANRPDFSGMFEEETPFSQLNDIYAALAYLKIPHVETTVCEADDVVAAYAYRYGKQMQVRILSFDSDFFQLVTDTVAVLRYRGDNTVLCDEGYVKEKFGVPASLYADWKCLVGDASDNVKGVRGIGPKTAAALLNEFQSLSALLENAERIKKPSIKEALLSSKERLAKNCALIRLNGCAALPFLIDELAYTFGGERTGEVLLALGIK